MATVFHRLLVLNIWSLVDDTVLGKKRSLGGGLLVSCGSTSFLPDLFTSWSSEMQATICVLHHLDPNCESITPSHELLLVRFLWQSHEKLNQCSSHCLIILHITIHHTFSFQTHQHDSPRWEPFLVFSFEAFLLERVASLARFWNGVMCDNCFRILEVLWYWIGTRWGVISLK